ncbi:membrane protein [Beggiatoa sp. PS]|nr:membrane protein [Beggiatoa sp. PS]
MSYSPFLDWFSIVLIAVTTIVAIAFMIGQLIVNYSRLFSNILSLIPDQFETVFELIAKIVRSFALHHIFDWILSIFDNYRYGKKHVITYGQSSTIGLSVLVILFYPDNLLVDESIMITIFALILLEKL